MENLTQAAHKLAEDMYKQTADAAAGNGAEEAKPADAGDEPKDKKREDVIDAEYEVKE